MRRCNLPDEIQLRTGEILKPVIGGHLENKPFLTLEHSGVDVTKSGWGADLPFGGLGGQEEKLIVKEAKRQKLKYRRLSVLSRNLRRSLDLHNRPYQATVWVFVQVTEATPPVYSMPADAVLFPQPGDE